MQRQTNTGKDMTRYESRQEPFHALTVSTMAVAIYIITIEGVGAPRRSSTSKLDVGCANAAIDDIGCDSRTVTTGCIRAVEGQILLVDAIESPCS